MQPNNRIQQIKNEYGIAPSPRNFQEEEKAIVNKIIDEKLRAQRHLSPIVSAFELVILYSELGKIRFETWQHRANQL